MHILLQDLFYLIPDFFFITFITILIFIAVINKNFYYGKDILKSVNNLIIIGLTFILLLNLTKITLPNVNELIFTSNFLLQENLHINLLKIILIFISLIIFIAAKHYYDTRNTLPFEVPIIILFSLFGILLVITTSDLMLLYLALELQSLSIYALVASRYNSNISTEAGLKYFILGSFISGFILYAISLFYFITGSTNLNNLNLYLINNNNSSIILLAMVLLTGGFLFKLSAAPFHNWTPDVFEGAPTIITLFISTVPKLAILSVIFNIYYIAYISLVDVWSYMFLISGVLSLIIGTIGGLYQIKIKRLLAFSTINNMGYILLGLNLASKASIEVTVFYLLIYIILNTGIFSIIIAILKDKTNKELIYINDLSIVTQKNPLLAFILTLNIFSLIGIPPLIGFFSKFYLLGLLVQHNLLFFAVIAIVTSLISTFYYIRLIKILYIKKDYFTENIKEVSESATFIIYMITCLNILLSLNIDYLLNILHLIVLSIYS